MSYHVQTPGAGKSKIAEQLRAEQLDGLLLTSPENVYYASGLPTLPGSGNPILYALHNQLPFFVYIDASGKTTLFCWIGATMGFTFDVDDVHSFFNRESALDELSDFIKTIIKPDIKIAIESSCPFAVLSKLYQFIQPSTLFIADDLMLQLRFRKTDQELALIRKATEIVEASVVDLQKEVRPGISRLTLINRAKQLMLQHGASGIGHTTIAFGTSNPEIAFDEKLEEGKVVILDLGAVVDGYTSDNRRLLYTGEVPSDLQTLHNTMCQIVNQIGERLRPGVTFADLYVQAAELYEQHGLPPFFISVGHSIGLQTEEAWISPDSSYIVQAGMVLNIELYTPHHDGSNIGDEETFLVTEATTIKLTQTNPAIRSI